MLADMTRARIDFAAANGIMVSGFEPCGFESNGKTKYRFQEWWLAYEEQPNVGVKRLAKPVRLNDLLGSNAQCRNASCTYLRPVVSLPNCYFFNKYLDHFSNALMKATGFALKCFGQCSCGASWQVQILSSPHQHNSPTA